MVDGLATDLIVRQPLSLVVCIASCRQACVCISLLHGYGFWYLAWSTVIQLSAPLPGQAGESRRDERPTLLTFHSSPIVRCHYRRSRSNAHFRKPTCEGGLRDPWCGEFKTSRRAPGTQGGGRHTGCACACGRGGRSYICVSRPCSLLQPRLESQHPGPRSALLLLDFCFDRSKVTLQQGKAPNRTRQPARCFVPARRPHSVSPAGTPSFPALAHVARPGRNANPCLLYTSPSPRD